MGLNRERRAVEVMANSETGCELRLREARPGAATPFALRLGHPLLADAPWAVEVECQSADRKGGLRLGLRWAPLRETQRERLQTHLYRRPGLWPTLRAPWGPTGAGDGGPPTLATAAA